MVERQSTSTAYRGLLNYGVEKEETGAQISPPFTADAQDEWLPGAAHEMLAYGQRGEKKMEGAVNDRGSQEKGGKGGQ